MHQHRQLVLSAGGGRSMASFHVARVRVSWTVLLALAHFTYLLVGATIFQILEREAENNNREYFLMEKLNFLANYTCLDGEALEHFVKVWNLLHCHPVCDGEAAVRQLLM